MGASKPAYLEIADRLAEQIRSGRRKPGEKLESIRQLAKTEGVSINTVRAAMEVLGHSGLVLSQPRRGVVVNPPPGRPSYQPFEQFEPDARLAQQSRDWLNTAVTPDKANNLFVNMVVPPDNAMFKSFQRHYRQCLLLPPKSAVEISAGNLHLREKIAAQLSRRQLRAVAADVQITNGCQNATEHALRVLTQPGDTVAVPTPAFPGYLALMSLLKLKTIEIPMTPGGPDPDRLQKVLRAGQVSALIINPICHNPTGISLDDDYKRTIARWADQYAVPVIEDDICAALSFFETHPRPVASFDRNGWVMLVSSISKVMGDSERIGWCLPGRFKDAYMTQFAISQIGSSYYRQKALALYLGGSRFTPQLRQWRRMLKSALDQAVERLEARLGDRVQITRPVGGYSLWVKLPPSVNSRRLRRQANLQRLDFLPGEFFSLEPRFKNYLRLVIVPPYSQRQDNGLEKLANLIRQSL